MNYKVLQWGNTVSYTHLDVYKRQAQILGGSCDIEVMEMHHRHKIDAPSGTARTLAEILSSSIYNPARSQEGCTESIICARPSWDVRKASTLSLIHILSAKKASRRPL